MTEKKLETKTIQELFEEYTRWRNLLGKGAMGNQQAYSEVRNTRKYFEEEKWVSVDALKPKIESLITKLETECENFPEFTTRTGLDGLKELLGLLDGEQTKNICSCCGFAPATEPNGLCKDCAEHCAGFMLKNKPCSTIEGGHKPIGL